MTQYRESRNIEASMVDQVNSWLDSAGWTSVRVEKAFSRVYIGTLPCILINIVASDLVRKEIGGKSFLTYYTVFIRLFATSDGQREDIADYLIEKLEDDIIYYVYTVGSGEIKIKTQSGIINIEEIRRNEKELENIENLAKEDRYRHVIELRVRIAI